ncbi:MAG: hypothetical protein NTY59_00935 [Alphaproteobacteria bacterium]|nr:hypothetical protein [Alphaproteobacteria bacterium]
MSLIRFWRDFAPRNGSPHVHPDDTDLFLKKGRGILDLPCANFRQFVRSERFGNFSDNQFHLSLLPVPYAGDLRRADIFILLLNPGFNFVDYYAEYESRRFRSRLLQNLRQKNHEAKFPFLYLDPSFCWHSGFAWWEGKFREVGKLLAEQRYEGSYLAALKELSRRVAAIELVPYHSTSFAAHKLVEQGLPSSVAAQSFVKSSLFPRAAAGEVTIIATRRTRDWGLAAMRKRRGVVCYRGGLTRGASLGPKTLGGRAILKQLGLKEP